MRTQDETGAAINLRQLAYFAALADHGSMSAAANALGVTQPSVSVAIARLEGSLGMPLARRVRKGIQLTEAGALLAGTAAEILAKLDQTLATIRAMEDSPRGHVRLGLPAGLSLSLSVPLIETIYAEHPEIRLSIIEGMSDEILRWIEEDRIDIGCVYGDITTSGLICDPLMTEEFFLVTAPDSWPGQFGPDGVAIEKISPEILAGLPIVSLGARGARSIQRKVETNFGIRLNIIATINSLPQIIEMVSRASAYAILTHGSVFRHVEAGQLALVPFGNAEFRLTSHLVRKRSRAVSKAATTVESCARLIAGEMVERHAIRGVEPGTTDAPA